MDVNFPNNNTTYTDHSCNVMLEISVEPSCNDVTIGSTLTYTIVLKNISDYSLESVYMIQDIIDGLKYQKNSLTINGRIPFEGDIDLNTSSIIPIGYVRKRSKITIIFDVIIDKIPSQFPIVSYSKAIYSYYNYNRKLIKDLMIISNKVSTYFDIKNETIYKECHTSRCQADLLTTLKKEIISDCSCNTNNINYLVSFTNTGEVPAYNVLIEDMLKGASFDKCSLKIYTDSPHGSKSYFGNLPKISIDEVCPGETIKIYFNVNVIKTLPSTNVSNYVNIYYQYYSNNCNSPINTHGRSNVVDTHIENKIESKLTINDTLSYQAEINTNINYRITIKNTSSTDLKNVSYRLQLPNGYEKYIEYKTDSLKITGGKPPIQDINPNLEQINVGTIKPNETVIIEFIEIALDKTPNPLYFYVKGYYSYKKYEYEKLVTCVDETNQVSLEIILPIVTISKNTYSYCPENQVGCVPQLITDGGVGDRITYKISITNNSAYTLENVLLNDVLPPYVKYVSGSLKINVTAVSYDFESNLLLPDIRQKTTLIVSFDVIIISLPPKNTINNTACVSYDYLVNPKECTRKKGNNCASNNLNVSYADLTIGATKVSNPKTFSRKDTANNTGTYTVTLKNSGNIDALNVKFTDLLPQGLTFIENSVTVTGVDKNGNTVPIKVTSMPPGGPLNIEKGIIIEKIPPQIIVTITYKFKVNLNAPDTIENTATFDYSFISNGKVITKPSNNTSTDMITVIDNILNLTQTAFPKSVCPGDNILYTIDISNLSRSEINNLILQSTIPNNTTLVSGSFTIDLKVVIPPVTSDELANGVDLGNLLTKPNNTKLIQYQLKVTDHSVTPIINTLNVYYMNGSIKSKVYTSSLSTPISNNCPTPTPCNIVSIEKNAYNYCDPKDISCIVNPVTIVSFGDRITYKVPIESLNSVTLSNVIFNDNLPSDITYVKNSLKIDGVTIPSGLIPNLAIGQINPNQTKIVSYDVIVNTIPSSANILNTACIKYKYTLNCLGCTEQQGDDCASNLLNITSPVFETSFVKYVDKVGTVENFSQPDDEISYILQFKNTGNKDAINVVLVDTIPSEVGYLLDSVIVTPSIPPGNITQPTSSNPVLTIKIDKLPVGQSYNILFDTALSPLIVDADVYNKGQLNYSYVSSSGKLVTKTVYSNTVVTHVNSANLVVTKAVSTPEANINTPVTYTITVKNTGSLVANNSFLTDLLPTTVVTYIPNTLKINGIPNSGNISSGLLLGTIKPKELITIQFQVQAPKAPAINPISNTARVSYTYVPDPITGKEVYTEAISNQVFLTINAADLISIVPTKESDIFIVSREDPANNFGNYTITLYNSGNINALNTTIVDTLPQGLMFVANSVVVTGTDKNGNSIPLKVNSIPPGRPLNIERGIIIENIPPYVTVKVKFGYSAAIDAPEFIENTAGFNYNYIVNQAPVSVPNNQTNTSTIISVKNGLDVYKTVVPATVCYGQTLLYTIELKNKISSSINNIILQDSIPLGTSLVPNSFILNLDEFTIDGNPITATNLANGIDIGNISIGEIDIVQFLVKVNSSTIVGPIVNTVSISYTNATIPSNIFTATATTTVPANCPNPCKCICNNCCNHICTHYGKHSCKPGKRPMCKYMNITKY